MYKFEVGDLITLIGLYSLSNEEMYKKPQIFPSLLEFIGIVVHVIPPTNGGWQQVGYNVKWLGDTDLSNYTIFFEEEIELIERGKE